MATISATDLARNTRQVLEVERNHTVVARIVAPERTMTAAEAFAGLSSMLTPQEAGDWLAESKDGFIDALRDPWA